MSDEREKIEVADAEDVAAKLDEDDFEGHRMDLERVDEGTVDVGRVDEGGIVDVGRVDEG